MAGLEDTLNDLQEEVTVAKEPPTKHFKPLWLLTAIAVFLLIGGGTFAAVERLTGNTETIDANCKQRNEQLATVNQKFEELNALILAVFRTRAEDDPAVLAAFEKLRHPIPTVECK
jgi:hypothetical protein